jgi:hypothetical protein
MGVACAFCGPKHMQGCRCRGRRRRRPIQLKLLPPALRVLRHVEQVTLGAAQYYMDTCFHITAELRRHSEEPELSICLVRR